MNKYFTRVEAIREMMASRGWDAVIITGSDPHNSEYPSPRWKQVEWVSGFSGEAGDIVITADHAGLWTDTRYFIQAGKDLPGTGIELHKMRVPEQIPIPQWLAEYAFPSEKSRITVAVDGLSQTVSSVKHIASAFVSSGRKDCREAEEDDLSFRIVDAPDFMDNFWSDRPSIPETPIITLGEDITGQSRSERITMLRKFLLRNSCDAILLTSLDEIAWVLNVRGNDIAYNPVVISYLLVTLDSVQWFVRKNTYSALDDETRDSFMELKGDDISIEEYDDVGFALASLDAERGIWVDPSSLNYNLYGTLEGGSMAGKVIYRPSPVPLWKAVKNPTEIEGMREAHLEDGLAMERFLYWLDCQMRQGYPVTEWDAALMLGSLRESISGYRGDSFETISAYGKGAALPHYMTPREDAPILENHGLYLCDSGGQYLFGTTDITRTVPLGPCTPLEKEDYTLVLKGMIDLAMAVFPAGTAGCQLDALARNPLWQRKRSFGHGTGHGIGFYLCVHEGPQDIRQNFNSQPLLPGMITSDEPGIYREGLHGVRHENLLLTVEAGTNDFGKWYAFETLTLCHFDTSPIVKELLDRREIDWLNEYNATVYRTLSPRLPSEVSEWLKEKTGPI